MRFVRNQDGNMVQETGENIIKRINNALPISSAYIVDVPSMKKKSKNFLKNSTFSFAPMMLATTGIDSEGVFWNTFLQYIFPYMLDIAKVYCLIRIAQAFYEEKRGGRDGGTGFQALITHGKWYLIFWLLPISVQLIDEIGHKMFTDLQNKTLVP